MCVLMLILRKDILNTNLQPHHAQYANQSCWNGLENENKAGFIFNSKQSRKKYSSKNSCWIYCGIQAKHMLINGFRHWSQA